MTAGRGRLSFLEEWSASQQFSDGERLHNVVRPPSRATTWACSEQRSVTMVVGPSKDNRILLQASSPLMPDMFTSKRIRSGRCRCRRQSSKVTIYAGYTHSNKLGTALITYASQI